MRVAAPITSNNVCVTQRYSLLLCYTGAGARSILGPNAGQGPETRSQHYPPHRGQ